MAYSNSLSNEMLEDSETNFGKEFRIYFSLSCCPYDNYFPIMPACYSKITD